MNHMKGISYLLLFCFSAFLGHNLVPHHHHAELYYNPVSTDCPYGHGDHPEEDQDRNTVPVEHPLHCHAFNEVAFEKYNAPLNQPCSGQFMTLSVPDQHPDEQVQGKYAHLFTFRNAGPCNSPHMGTRALRGPPRLT